jgi:cytochrome b subunit of formate dehydrogenase
MSAQAPAGGHVATHTHYRRFHRVDRLLHGFLMFSFLGLAFTGLPLLFSHGVGGDPRAVFGVHAGIFTASARS